MLLLWLLMETQGTSNTVPGAWHLLSVMLCLWIKEGDSARCQGREGVEKYADLYK